MPRRFCVPVGFVLRVRQCAHPIQISTVSFVSDKVRTALWYPHGGLFC